MVGARQQEGPQFFLDGGRVLQAVTRQPRHDDALDDIHEGAVRAVQHRQLPPQPRLKPVQELGVPAEALRADVVLLLRLPLDTGRPDAAAVQAAAEGHGLPLPYLPSGPAVLLHPPPGCQLAHHPPGVPAGGGERNRGAPQPHHALEYHAAVRRGRPLAQRLLVQVVGLVAAVRQDGRRRRVSGERDGGVQEPLAHGHPLPCPTARPSPASPLPPPPPPLHSVHPPVPPQHEPHLVVAPGGRRHGGHHGHGRGHAAGVGRRLQRVLLEVVLGADRVQDGGEGLFAERTLGLVVGPLLNAREAEAVQAPVQVGQVVEPVQADGTLGVGRGVLRHRQARVRRHGGGAGRRRRRGGPAAALPPAAGTRPDLLFLWLPARSGCSSAGATTTSHTQFHLSGRHRLKTRRRGPSSFSHHESSSEQQTRNSPEQPEVEEAKEVTGSAVNRTREAGFPPPERTAWSRTRTRTRTRVQPARDGAQQTDSGPAPVSGPAGPGAPVLGLCDLRQQDGVWLAPGERPRPPPAGPTIFRRPRSWLNQSTWGWENRAPRAGSLTWKRSTLGCRHVLPGSRRSVWEAVGSPPSAAAPAAPRGPESGRASIKFLSVNKRVVVPGPPEGSGSNVGSTGGSNAGSNAGSTGGSNAGSNAGSTGGSTGGSNAGSNAGSTGGSTGAFQRFL